MINIFLPIKIVLKEKKYALLFISLAIIFFAIFVLIPVFTVLGNDLAFQLSTYSFTEFLLMVFLALLISLTFSLQIYVFRQKKFCSIPKSITQGTATGVSGIFAAILGTAFCAACLIPLFAAVGLGSGAIFFVLENQPYFLTGVIMLMLVSLYFAARKVNKICRI